jgi:hypothetical protein
MAIAGAIGIITADEIANGSVTNDKLANSSLTINGTAIALGASDTITAGKILQVLQAVKTDTQNTNSTSRVDISGLSIAITPASSSNKILVMFDVAVGTAESTGSLGAVYLMRGSSDIYIGDAASNRARASAQIDNNSGDMSFSVVRNTGIFLDSPSSTDAQTYKLQFETHNGANSVFINQSGDDTDASYIQRVPSSITVMEVAA